MKKFLLKNRYYLILIVLVSFVNISLIFNNNVWCDEAFILNACKLDINALLHYIAFEDMRPPLYLLMIKGYLAVFGHSVPVAKFFSIIPAILTMILGATIVDKNWGQGKRIAGTIFVLLVGLSPSGMTKNIEITIYSWAMFFVVGSVLLAYEIYMHYNSKARWILFVTCSVAAAGVHYYALVTEIYIYAILLIVLVKKNKVYFKRWLWCCLATVLGYIPVLPFFYYQFTSVKKSFWIQRVDIHTILRAIRMPFEGDNTFIFTNEFTMAILIFVIGSFFYYVLCIYEACKKHEKKNSSDVFCVLLGIILVLFLISGYTLSKIIRPIFLDRYFYNVTGILWLYIAITVAKVIGNNKALCYIIGGIFTIFLFSYSEVYTREYSDSTKKTVDFIGEQLESDDIFVNNIEECASWELEYYFPDHKYYLNCPQGTRYKDQVFDFSTLDTTAWYICQDDFDLDMDELEADNLNCEYMGTWDLDNYYFFTIYKIQPK